MWHQPLFETTLVTLRHYIHRQIPCAADLLVRLHSKGVDNFFVFLLPEALLRDIASKEGVTNSRLEEN